MSAKEPNAEPVRAGLETVSLPPGDAERFQTVLDAGAWRSFTEAAARARPLLADRRVWNLNSTAVGGGVAEMLAALVPLSRALGVDAHWLVVKAEPEFFQLTKRLHNLLHSGPGVEAPELDDQRELYKSALGRAAAELGTVLKRGDVLVVHDPQPAGLIPVARRLGARVVWRCHIGTDDPGPAARRVWQFLLPYVSQAEATVFSRATYRWDGLDAGSSFVIAPSIDPFSPKNQDLAPEATTAILEVIGLLQPGSGDVSQAVYTRTDGSRGRVERAADIQQDEQLPARVPIVLQVSRWDRLKDMTGVLREFVSHVPQPSEAHLVLAGAAVVPDDPEGQDVLDEVRDLWAGLPAPARRRVHLLTLPMDDVQENAAMVNALQRQAAVVVQKSLEEGFGLTVAEAMWKQRAVLASRRGGIQDQIVDRESGWLLDDPRDLDAFGLSLRELLAAPDMCERLGRAARERVRREFLAPRHLERWGELLQRLLASG